MMDPIGELLRALDFSRGYHDIPRPHDGPLHLQRADTLAAMTAHAEARGEGRLGMLLVLCVIRNRVALSPRFGAGWGGVILRRQQFSCWNDPGTARSQLRQALDLGRGPDFESWSLACGAAFDVIKDRCPDLTGGAQFYFADWIEPPAWSAGMTHTVTYRQHRFFREE